VKDVRILSLDLLFLNVFTFFHGLVIDCCYFLIFFLLLFISPVSLGTKGMGKITKLYEIVKANDTDNDGPASNRADRKLKKAMQMGIKKSPSDNGECKGVKGDI
jgi:hypothetical protein